MSSLKSAPEEEEKSSEEEDLFIRNLLDQRTSPEKEAIQTPIQEQAPEERRLSMDRVSDSIKEFLQDDGSERNYLPEQMDWKTFRKQSQESKRDNSQDQQDRKLSWFERKFKCRVRTSESMDAKETDICRSSTEDGREEGLKNLSHDLQQELKIQPDTVINIDSSSGVVSAEEDKKTTRLNWLGRQDGYDQKVLSRVESIKKYTRSRSWYDDVSETSIQDTSRNSSTDVKQLKSFRAQLDSTTRTDSGVSTMLKEVLEAKQEVELTEEEVKPLLSELVDRVVFEPRLLEQQSISDPVSTPTIYVSPKVRSKKLRDQNKKTKMSIFVEDSQTDWNLPEEFETNFHFYMNAAQEKVNESPQAIPLAAVNRWLEDAGILNHKNITVIHTGLCFNRLAHPDRYELEMEEFLKFVELISNLMQKPFADAMTLLSRNFREASLTYSSSDPSDRSESPEDMDSDEQLREADEDERTGPTGGGLAGLFATTKKS